ncbi:OLC1v1020303C1 [Oldenlandia corymbosa var. corymbosa]|uniref:OLC1v1020303C1 n=1 Tax=Oldenlandia corymbosa var. corymbosa TaxID=529605 RepID=A0AAV1EGM1_OLDCO|nr:OLC1v1020303C1 [Oldenlandia corymbosa var. corymbosa]
MNHINFLVCSTYIFLTTLLAEGYLGINWGRVATQRMIPSMVVDMLLQNSINDVKVFSFSSNVLEPIGGTNISLAVTMPNEEFEFITDLDNANKWINLKFIKYKTFNVNFKYLYIGFQPLSTKFGPIIYNTTADVLERMQKALVKEKLGITATMSHYTDILNYETLKKPSMAEFKPDLKNILSRICKTLQSSNSTFGIDIFTILNVQEHFNNVTEFAFFDNNSTFRIQDGNLTYTNAFEAMYDSTVWALEKLGFPDLPVSVGATGWPTDGTEESTPENAQRYLQGLANFLMSNKGTPKRPGISIDAYIHNLADENSVRTLSGNFTRHFGIYKFDGTPKFNLDLQGKQRPVMPVSAIGITHMPTRWCILDVLKIDSDKIPYETLDRFYNSSCKRADCTPMSPGGSCASLKYPLNYSFAFNIAFQATSQKVQGNSSCDFGGYGVIVADDPSTGKCIFPVEIIPAETSNFLGQRTSSSQPVGIRPSSSSLTVILQFLFILLFTLAL